MTKETIKHVKDGLSRQKLFSALEYIELLEKENEQLKQENEQLKCCGNCKNVDFDNLKYCYKGTFNANGNYYCTEWEQAIDCT